MEMSREAEAGRGRGMKYEAERCSLLGNVEQPNVAKTQGPSKRWLEIRLKLLVLATLCYTLDLRNWKLIC